MNDSIKNVVIGAVVSLMVAFVAVSMMQPTQGPAGRDGRDGKDATVGSVTGPDSFFECETHNGFRICSTGKELTVASSTACALKSPSATSTLLGTGLSLRTGTSTAVTLRVATSSTPFATTTVLWTQPVASGALGAWNFSPTTTAVQVFSPNTYIIWDAQGFVGGDSTKFRGTCGAQFIGI